MPDINRQNYSLTARWIFPVSSPPVENGVIEIESGRISAVHNRPPGRDVVDCGNVALIPGLVNTHTHLEFSDLRLPVEPALPFTAWIKSLVGIRRSNPATAAVIQQGLAESCETGTTLVGEIATQDWPTETYHNFSLQTIVFRELIGMLPDRAAAQLEIARQWLAEPAPNGSSVTRGLSPHAPYSVHPDLYRDLIQLAADKQAPVAVHLAETPAELEFLDRGTGEFVEMLQRFNAWDPQSIPRGSRPLDYLRPLESVPRSLVIHGNYLGATEFAWLENHPRTSVVYCPRTHAYFQHTPHPWQELLARGINVALGTDSRGSNPDLSLWREMQHLRDAFPDMDPATILDIGTRRGAEALGLSSEIGSFEPGKLANGTWVELQAESISDPYVALFSGEATQWPGFG